MYIYIVSHLRLRPPAVQGYRVMYVGPLSSGKSPDTFSDTDAQLDGNIAHKNKTFCELTALHQIAQKHAHQPNAVVGLVHYRRRFLSGPAWMRKVVRTTQKASWSRGISNWLLRHFELTQSQASLLLDSCDVILPRSTKLKKSVRESYMDSHISEDWIQLKKIIHAYFPDYGPAFDQFENQKNIHLYNMFVSRSGFLQSYAKWLFAVLERLEQVININGRDAFQSRVFGFLSERLFNIYLLKNSEFKTLHLPVVQIYNESVVRKE